MKQLITYDIASSSAHDEDGQVVELKFGESDCSVEWTDDQNSYVRLTGVVCLAWGIELYYRYLMFWVMPIEAVKRCQS